jgi:hypothetical protein
MNLNPKTPLEGLKEAMRKVRHISHPTLIENNSAFHWLLVEGVSGSEQSFSTRRAMTEFDSDTWVAGVMAAQYSRPDQRFRLLHQALSHDPVNPRITEVSIFQLGKRCLDDFDALGQ